MRLQCQRPVQEQKQAEASTALSLTFLHLNGVGIGKQVAIIQRAMNVVCYISDSVDIVSIVNPMLHFLHIIQLVRQRSANEFLNTNRAVAAKIMHVSQKQNQSLDP